MIKIYRKDINTEDDMSLWGPTTRPQQHDLLSTTKSWKENKITQTPSVGDRDKHTEDNKKTKER